MHNSVQQPKSRLKLGAVLKLVTLEKSAVIDLKIRHKTKWKPLSPNDFNVYAYPELRLGYNDDDFYDYGDTLLETTNNINMEDNQQLNINNFNDDIIDEKVDEGKIEGKIDETPVNVIINNNDKLNKNSSVSLKEDVQDNNIIHDDEYIERLHKEIDKRARIEFNNGMGEATSNSELKNILSNLNNNVEKPAVDTEKLVIVQKVKPSNHTNENSQQPVVAEKIQSTINQKDSLPKVYDNKDSEVKFTIKLDRNEQNKYYTDVLDAVDKIFDEGEDKPFKTMTDIVDEILSQDNNQNKKN